MIFADVSSSTLLICVLFRLVVTSSTFVIANVFNCFRSGRFASNALVMFSIVNDPYFLSKAFDLFVVSPIIDSVIASVLIPNTSTSLLCSSSLITLFCVPSFFTREYTS